MGHDQGDTAKIQGALVSEILPVVSEAALGATVNYLIAVSLALFVGPVELAAYRVAMSAFGLPSFVINFARTSLMRHISPQRLTPTAWPRTFVGMCGLLGSVVVIAYVVVVLLPVSWGVAVFGGIWTSVLLIALPTALNRLAASLSVTPMILLRVQGVTWPVVRVRIAISLGLLVLAPLTARSFGADGVLLVEAVGHATAWLALAVMSRRQVRSLTPGERATDPAPPA